MRPVEGLPPSHEELTMRHALFVALSGAILAGCGPDLRAVPLGVSWLEWPAEVRASEPFDVRMSGYLPACGSHFVPAYHADLSAVSFEPYALVPQPPPCVNIAALHVAPPVFAETITVSSLEAAAPRTYEMRAATHTSAVDMVIRTFGDIVVRPDSIQMRRFNAVGHAFAARDQAGCLRIYPVAGYSTGYAIENPPDTTSNWSAFVRGYVVTGATPVCGDSTVFHLVTRN
jgi:hypothetical protein